MKTDLMFQDFGHFIKDLRMKSGLSQKDLAQKIGCTKQPLSSWENNHKFPGKKALKRISEIFHISSDRLLFMHKRQKAVRLQNLISQSKDPVVANIKPYSIVILDKKAKSLSLKDILSLRNASHRHFYAPIDIPEECVFAFEIGDEQMSPNYHSGDIVLVDMRRALKDGEPVIIKRKGHSPVCRIYFDGFGVKLLKKASMESPALKINNEDIEWCYAIMNPVVRH